MFRLLIIKFVDDMTVQASNNIRASKVFMQTLENFHRFTSILNDASRLSRPVYENDI